MKLDYDWSKETFELIRKCVLKRYNAEVHMQASLEATDVLRKEHELAGIEIDHIHITTFLTAYHITGSGAYGDRKTVATKEQADHSLFYTTAALLLDGELFPDQFTPERILQADVQELLQKVKVGTGLPFHKPVMIAGLLDPYTVAYPDKMTTKVEIKRANGETYSREQEDYHGFHTRPLSWSDTLQKFNRLTRDILTPEQQDQVITIVRNLENCTDMNQLTQCFSLTHQNESR